MGVSLEGDVIHLRGACPVEDAEPLLSLLQGNSGLHIDLRASGHLHTAVIQVLLAFRPVVVGPAADPFVETWLRPIMSAGTAC